MGLLDLAVGCCFFLLALGLARRRREHATRHLRQAMLAAATSGLWFLGDVLGAAALAHRGSLTHLLLGESRRKPRRIMLAVVTIAYVDGLILPLGRLPIGTLVVGVLVATVATRSLVRARGTARRAQVVPLFAAVMVWGVLCAGALARLIGRRVDAQVLTVYEVVLIVAAVVVLVDVRFGRWRTSAITSLAIDLGHGRALSLRDRLAEALGDPSLVLAYPDANGTFRDETRQQVVVGSQQPGRTVTLLTDGGRTIAALVHDTAVLDDRVLLEAVGSLAKITIANRQLAADAQARYVAVEESRQRLLSIGDEERARLEAELRTGAESQLEHAAKILRDLPDRGGRLAGQLAASQASIREFARGVHPRTLGEAGVAAAVAELVQSAPIAVTCNVPQRRFDPAVEIAAYFVCAEALTNTAKYAPSATAEVSMCVGAGALRVEVADDGPGGAELANGSGLRGLADRVDVLGGAFTVHSPPGGGTRVTAVLPLTPAGRSPVADSVC